MTAERRDPSRLYGRASTFEGRRAVPSPEERGRLAEQRERLMSKDTKVGKTRHEVEGVSGMDVTAKVARVIASDTDEVMWSAVVVARNALAALSDPEVLAGVAGVLREHGLVRAAYRDSSYGPGIVCRCGAVVDQALDETTQETQAHHEAAEVVKWLRGQG